MTIYSENNNSFFMSSQAVLVDEAFDASSTWASKYIRTNPALKWVLGRYVEADNPNGNGQAWRLSGLEAAIPNMSLMPLNINHERNQVVGATAGAELLFDSTSDIANPIVEVVAAYWRSYNPETLIDVEKAFNEGKLFFSQECVGSHVTCSGEGSCGQSFPYMGPFDESYCDCINSRESSRVIENPLFLGAALIVPPINPGWKSADIKEIAKHVSDEVANEMFANIASEAPHLSNSEVEVAMWSLQMAALNRLASK